MPEVVPLEYGGRYNTGRMEVEERAPAALKRGGRQWRTINQRTSVLGRCWMMSILLVVYQPSLYEDQARPRDFRGLK